MNDSLAISSTVEAAHDDDIGLGKLLLTIWLGKWWVVLTTVLAITVGGLYAFRLAVPIYTAAATVALESREQSVVDFESVVSGLSGDQSIINTEIEVLQSRGLIGKLVDRLDLTTDPEFNATLRPDGVSLGSIVASVVPWLAPEPMEAPTEEQIRNRTINAVLDALSITNIRNSLVFRISVRSESAATATEIANALADLYILEQIEVKFEATARATAWLSEKVAEQGAELEAVQDELTAFTAVSELVTPEEVAALNRQIADLRTRITGMDGATDADEGVAETLQAALDAEDFARILELTGDRALARIMSLDAPSADALRARSIQLVETARSGDRRNVAQARALRVSLAELEAQLAAQSEALLQRQGLERAVEQAQLLFDYFQNRLRETAVQQGIQQADARILSSAVVPINPTSPRKPLILALSAILGMMAGAGALIFREQRQTGYRSAEQLEAQTGVTVMGQLPRVKIKSRKAMLDYLAEKPTSRLAEAFRNLRTSVMLSNLDTPPKVIMSTSSLPGEGKTTQSLALAQNFASLGKTVLLIECDVRRRIFAQKLGFTDGFGLISVLSGEAELGEVIQHSPQLGRVDVLIGEKSNVNPVDTFQSDRFAQFLSDMRARYDVVVIDTAPVLAVPDSRVIAQKVDAVLYSVKWNDTPRSAVREGLRLLETARVKVSGLVLTQIDLAGMEKMGYGEYGRYGRGYYSD
ncbi:polysaccharide biosynthesis tyrosine autokinase [uncultured Jannaschia sp.]|uniref:polysaccharide biosynthesis tyrosine autokinase n=1 Tax=uncultured Jannaschia sp. TaxID=293347 RepID=UPI0026306835|nr:polysaccharide biosynthesis tyrosine autokinase [uncultured Jannaschia sp.]